jgi:hypothetical protein
MTYQIHRYPADLIDVVWLAGERVVDPARAAAGSGADRGLLR